jgi:transcriptional regulator with XRE-family HTH domain
VATTRKKKRSDPRQSARANDDQRIVADLLATVRKETGVTQTDLGDRLGRPQSWIAKGERVERRVDLLEVIAICDALRYDPCEFVRRLRKALRSAARRDDEARRFRPGSP